MRYLHSDTLQAASRLLLILAVLTLFGTANAVRAQDDFFEDDFFAFDEFDGDDRWEIHDPFENFNRSMFRFNDALYRNVAKPVARGLRVIPEPVRVSGSNFFNNFRTPVSGVNALLQLNFQTAGSEFSRFIINSTLGLLGFFDPATSMGLEANREDFGQTLGAWGFDHGFYLVLPFYGPSSLRDALGRPADTLLDPMLHAWDPAFWDYVAFRVVEAEIDLSLDQDTYEALWDSSPDPYAFFRNAYVQRRAALVER